jgi:GMP synthase-like glutamine amidotransferase
MFFDRHGGSADLILYIDLEHERLRQEEVLWRYFAARILETKYRLEAISGQVCLILQYRRVAPSIIRQVSPEAVVVGGNYTGFQHFEEIHLQGLYHFLAAPPCPVLCICGSFQLLVKACGGVVGPMAPSSTASEEVRDTDTPLPPALLPTNECQQAANGGGLERGFLPVRILAPHPLFQGMSNSPVFYELHGGEVKRPPDSFSVLAATPLCPVQAVAHKDMALFGTQFHPECYDAQHPDGRRLLENFFSLAGLPR